jgi:hypothetical protein
MIFFQPSTNVTGQSNATWGTSLSIMRYTLNAISGTIVAGYNGEEVNNTQLYYLASIYFESVSSSLLIVNQAAQNLVRWRLGDTSWTHIFGSQNLSSGTTSTLFNRPIGMTLAPMGNIYVANILNHRIQI